MPTGFTNRIPTEGPGRVPWRLFWLLLVASLAGVAAATPLFLELFEPMTRNVPRPNIPLPLIIVVGVVENLALLSLAIGVGLLLARKIGLGAPLLESWLYRRTLPATARDSIKDGVLAGTAVGIVLLVCILVAAPHFPGLPFVSAARAAFWKRFLVGFYGGIDEEIIARLFLLSLLSWLGVKFFRGTKLRYPDRFFGARTSLWRSCLVWVTCPRLHWSCPSLQPWFCWRWCLTASPQSLLDTFIGNEVSSRR